MELTPAKLQQALLHDLVEQSVIYRDQPHKLEAIDCLAISLFKKLEIGGTSSRERALNLFKTVNARTDSFTVDALSGTSVPIAIGQARKFLHELTFFQDYIPDPSKGRFGPGATIGADNESLSAKLWSSLTYTNRESLRFYRRALLCSPSAWAAEIARHTRLGESEVRSARLTTVPKTMKIDRVICIEPLCNMFLQQSIRFDLEATLRRVGIDIRSQQTYNRRLARMGSVTGGYATIDLSSASDTVSRSFCRYMLPSSLFMWLDLARSHHVDIDGEEVEMHMMSTMGNATTFPLQTLVFLALVRGVYETLGIPFRPRSTRANLGNCGVFGDDIIVVTEAAPLMLEVLERCGMMPNPDKTFISGSFRESCGGDYFDGYTVRGIYIKSLVSRNDLFSAYNRLARWSTQHMIMLPRALGYLRSCVGKPLFVPIFENDDAGFHDCRLYGAYTGSFARGERIGVGSNDPDYLLQLALAGSLLESNGMHLCTVRPRSIRYQDRRRKAFSWDLREEGPRFQVAGLPQLGGDPFCEEWAAARSGRHGL